jgi:hypothetical protein
MSAWGIEWWAPVPSHADCEVSTLGRVRSLDRVVVEKSGRRRWQKGRILKQPLNSGGYPTVGLPGRSVKVHLLGARTFLGECPAGLEVCHRDDVKSDSRLFQLRYDTHAANMQDALLNGRNYWANKTHCPVGHANQEVVVKTAARIAPDGRSQLGWGDLAVVVESHGFHDRDDIAPALGNLTGGQSGEVAVLAEAAGGN